MSERCRGCGSYYHDADDCLGRFEQPQEHSVYRAEIRRLRARVAELENHNRTLRRMIRENREWRAERDPEYRDRMVRAAEVLFAEALPAPATPEPADG